MGTLWTTRVERLASAVMVREAALRLAAAGEATFWVEVESARNLTVKDYEDPNMGESALQGLFMLQGFLHIKPKGAIWDAAFPVNHRVEISQHAASGTTVFSVQGKDPTGRLLNMALHDDLIVDVVIRAIGKVEYVPSDKAPSPTEQAWAWLTEALKHRRLPTSTGQDRVVSPSEFGLMNPTPQGGKWQFKHQDSRNYVFIDAKNGKITIPQTNEPFMRGQFDKLAASGLSKVQVMKLMKQFGIPGEVTGAGAQWEVELPDDAAKRKFEKNVVKDVGGFKTGYGGWVLKPGYQDQGDYNDPSSKWHYADGPASSPVKVGDIFYSSWGYDQTNIDFYEVAMVTPAMIGLRQMHSKVVKNPGGPQEGVMPVPHSGSGPIQRKKLKNYNGQWLVRLNSFSNAYLWKGDMKWQTGGDYGH